jgi:hypothetical protein
MEETAVEVSFVEWLGLGRDGPGIFGSQAPRPGRGT